MAVATRLKLDNAQMCCRRLVIIYCNVSTDDNWSSDWADGYMCGQ